MTAEPDTMSSKYSGDLVNLVSGSFLSRKRSTPGYAAMLWKHASHSQIRALPQCSVAVNSTLKVARSCTSGEH